MHDAEARAESCCGRVVRGTGGLPMGRFAKANVSAESVLQFLRKFPGGVHANGGIRTFSVLRFRR